MDKRDEQFENFLREFTPAQPRALPEQSEALHELRQSPFVWQRRLAAAAGIAIVAAGAAWFASRRPESSQAKVLQPTPEQARIHKPDSGIHTTLMLTKLAVEDPAQFETALTAASQDILPRFDGPNSSLRVLAKD